MLSGKFWICDGFNYFYKLISFGSYSESPQQKEIVSQYFEIVNGFSVLLTDDEVDALKGKS